MKTRRILVIAAVFGMAMSVSAQDVTTSKYGVDSVATVTNLSIYREAYKQWEQAKFAPEAATAEMVNAWRYVFLNGPRASQYTYTNGEKILDYLIRTNPSQKDAYIDTLNMLADTRAISFPTDPKTGLSQVANIKAKKGYLIYSYNKNRYEEAYNVLKEAVALDVDHNQIQVGFLDAYFRAAADMVNNGKAEKMTVIDVYQELSDVLDDNIKVLAEKETELLAAKEASADDAEAVANFDKQLEKNEKNINNYKGVKNNIDNLFEPFASCEDLLKVFTAKMAEKPDDIALLQRITTILDKKDCTDSKLFFDASKHLHELDPSPESAYNLGQRCFKDKKYGEAANYFEQATKSSNNDRVFRAYRNLAYCYLNTGSFSKGREAARKAAQVDPTAGEPYIIIGMLYAESASQFSGDLESKAVYWAAVDKFQKARSMDASVAKRASDLIAAYSQYFPPMETIFFNDYAEGQSYNVGGWIGETTTIRARK
ncbi:MAG: tetratricopeptide repeat protein [Bacteroidales bacterium]|nr:tetratricopeptide repeat protein [Bacteroidales bacterium]